MILPLDETACKEIKRIRFCGKINYSYCYLPLKCTIKVDNSISNEITLCTQSSTSSSKIVTDFIPVCDLFPTCSSDIVIDFIPVCTLSPTCSSDIVTDFLLSR